MTGHPAQLMLPLPPTAVIATYIGDDPKFESTTFESLNAAARYLTNSGDNVSFRRLRRHVKLAMQRKTPYFGFLWEAPK